MTPPNPELPKAELHVHLEGTASPAMVRQLAEKNGVAVPERIFGADGKFAWTDFSAFLAAYDLASATIRSADDYRAVTYDYLARSARDGVIYCEVMASPDHAAANGISYEDHVEGTAAGIEQARAEFGIEGRIIITCVRHSGPEAARKVADKAAAAPHPLVVGFGMGGDERSFSAADFRPAFEVAAKAGLACTSHAGEVAGAQSVRDSLDHLPISRIGHGVRAVEDMSLVRELARRAIPLEVCPGSNVATGIYPSLADHPLPRLMEAGCKVTLNSDDPPYFATWVAREYERTAATFGLDEAALKGITRTAIEAAFCDEATRKALLARI